jgi:hypothetical protein
MGCDRVAYVKSVSFWEHEARSVAEQKSVLFNRGRMERYPDLLDKIANVLLI